MSAPTPQETPAAEPEVTPIVAPPPAARPKRPLTEKQLANLAKGRETRDARRAERKTVRAEEHETMARLQDEEREVKRLKREALEKLIDERVEARQKLKEVIKAADAPKRGTKRARAEESSDSDSDNSNTIQLPKAPRDLVPGARGPAPLPSTSHSPVAARPRATTKPIPAPARRLPSGDPPKRQLVFM